MIKIVEGVKDGSDRQLLLQGVPENAKGGAIISCAISVIMQ